VDVAATREERLGFGGLIRTLAVTLSLAGLACSLTLVFLSMRSVMNVGGFCAEGGPYQIRQHCPQGIPGIMIGSIWGGLILAFAYAVVVSRWAIPGLVHLAWSALFLSLGWNFFEYAFDPPGTTKGIIWGWLICGVVFAAMGGFPLFVTVPAIVRQFLRGEEPQHEFPGGVPVGHARRAAQRFGLAPTGDRLVSDLERLDSLLQSGALTQEEYARAKKRLLGES
jgi:hypothetical protein